MIFITCSNAQGLSECNEMAEAVRAGNGEYGLSGRIYLLDTLQDALFHPSNQQPVPDEVLDFEEGLSKYLVPDIYEPKERLGKLPGPRVRERRAREVALLMPALFTELFLEGVISEASYGKALTELPEGTPNPELEAGIFILIHGDVVTTSAESTQLPLFGFEHVA